MPRSSSRTRPSCCPSPRGACSCATPRASAGSCCSPAATSSMGGRRRRRCAWCRSSTTGCRRGCSIPTGWRRPIAESAITRPFPFNGYYPEEQAPDIDEDRYKLVVDGLVAQQAALDARPALRAAAGDADHPAHLRRGLERHRQMDRRAAQGVPHPHRRRPDRQVRAFRLRRGLLGVDRHADRPAPADADDLQVRRRDPARPGSASPCASASPPSSASRTPSTSSASPCSTTTPAATGRTRATTGSAGFEVRT